MLLADEVTRRDRQAATLRAARAGLDPTMVLEAWDDTTAVAFDRQLWSELCSLRFLTDAHTTLVMGPVGVGKTFLATALGHAAVRRRHSVHFERADKLFKRLRAARLDHTYDEELRKLHRVELLILDDLALHPLGTTETSDFYELVVERHRHHSTITTSNRDPAEMVTMMADPLLAQSARSTGSSPPRSSSSSKDRATGNARNPSPPAAPSSTTTTTRIDPHPPPGPRSSHGPRPPRWSLPHGRQVVPSRWQATTWPGS